MREGGRERRWEMKPGRGAGCSDRLIRKSDRDRKDRKSKEKWEESK